MSYLTSFARSVRESIFFAQISLVRRSVCTKTSGKYFPVQTSDTGSQVVRNLPFRTAESGNFRNKTKQNIIHVSALFETF